MRRAVLVGAVLLFGGCGSGGDSFMDRETLAAELEQKAQARDSTVGDVTCVESGTHRFICGAEASDGRRFTTTVTVSADGKSYISGP